MKGARGTKDEATGSGKEEQRTRSVLVMVLLMLLHDAVQTALGDDNRQGTAGREVKHGGCEDEIVTAQHQVVCNRARKWRRTDRQVQGGWMRRLAERKAYHVARDALALG